MFSFVFLVLIFFFLLSRLGNLYDFPLFTDEAFFISLAEKINSGQEAVWYPITQEQQPSLIWLISLFKLIVSNGIWAGRLVGVFFGLLSLVMLSLLSRNLKISKGNILLPFFYLIIPFTLVYDRLAMFETLVGFAIILSFLSYLHFIKKETKLNFIVFFLALLFALFTKETAVFAYLLISLFLISDYKKLGIKKIFLVFLGFGLSFLIYSLINKLAYPQMALFGKAQGHLAFGEFVNLGRIKRNLWLTRHWLQSYLTLPVFYLTFIFIIWGFLKKQKTIIIFSLYLIVIILFEVLVGRTFLPRYLFPVIFPAAVIFSCGVGLFSKTIKNKVFTIIILGLVFLPALLFDFKIIFTPETAPFALEDRFQFYEDWTAGYKAKELESFLGQQAKDKKIFVIADLEIYSLRLVYDHYENKNNLVVVRDHQFEKAIKEKSSDFLKDYPEKNLFLIRSRHPGLPENWPVKLIKKIPKTKHRNIEIYQY